ncbi:MAG: hypothetical protein IPJ65_28550 [Archangiaceae bacterium]|nr:hypothetical protein [Archangiaceae bacterium]
MKIAIIGWGSLVWDRGVLRIVFPWKDNGPQLPVEFSRISKTGERAGALTLVLAKDVAPSTTCWALSAFEVLGDARQNLLERERCRHLRDIHCVDRTGNTFGSSANPVAEAIATWLRAMALDAAVWTGLGSNWEKEQGTSFTVSGAVAYLCSLTGDARVVAEQYVMNAPRGVDTPVRRALAARGWN